MATTGAWLSTLIATGYYETSLGAWKATLKGSATTGGYCGTLTTEVALLGDYYFFIIDTGWAGFCEYNLGV